MSDSSNLWGARESSRFRHDPAYELEMVLLDINEQIVGRLNALGWRKVDFARRLGVSRAFVTKLLDGNENLTLRTLVKVSNALGLKIRLDLLPRHIVDFLESTEEFLPIDMESNSTQSNEVNEGERQIPLAA